MNLTWGFSCPTAPQPFCCSCSPSAGLQVSVPAASHLSAGSGPWAGHLRLSESLPSHLYWVSHVKRGHWPFFFGFLASLFGEVPIVQVCERKTSYPMGIVMVRYFLFQPALQLELKGGASSLPGKCTSPVTRGGRAGGSHTVGPTTGGAQWQRVACPSAQFWGVVYLVVPQRSALTLSFISPDDSGSCLISF